MVIRIETPAHCGGGFRLASFHADVFHLAWFCARLTPVSYKHLPAHETGLELGWRLLLGKKKKKVLRVDFLISLGCLYK